MLVEREKKERKKERETGLLWKKLLWRKTDLPLNSNDNPKFLIVLEVTLQLV